MPLGSEKVGYLAAAGVGGGNYFGSGSDGSVTTSGDVSLALPSGNDMVVANYTDLDISSGDTLTVASANRGLLLYCSGNPIVDGTLSMSLRGCSCDPTAAGGSDSAAVSATGLRLPMLTASGGDTLAAADFAGCGTTAVTAVANQPAIAGDGTIFVVSQVGATGGSSSCCGPSCSHPGTIGNTGNAGTTGGATISTGGGATGGTRSNHGTSCSGTGGTGGAFSSGAGSGGASRGPCSTSVGANYGGSGSPRCCGGGCGGGHGPGAGGGDNIEGHGGMMWVVVKGNVTVGASGSIEAHGGRGQISGLGAAAACGGGGTGGGAIHILYGGTLTNNGSIAANGGGSGGTVAGVAAGGTGGAGGVNTTQVLA